MEERIGVTERERNRRSRRDGIKTGIRREGDRKRGKGGRERREGRGR